MIFGVLDRYIGKTVLLITLIAAGGLTVISDIITFIDQSRHLGDGDVDFMFLLWYVALLTPGLFVQLFPVAVLLGCVIGLGMLSKNSELVVMQSAGLSKLQLILSACKMVVPVVLVVALMGQTVVPMLQQYAQSEYSFASSGGRVSRISWGLWLRDGSHFINIGHINTDQTLHNINRYTFDGTVLSKTDRANIGIYNQESHMWDIFDVTTTHFSDQKITQEHSTLQQWNLYLNPERMEIFNLYNRDFTVSELIDYISYLESNNIDANRYKTNLYKKFILPVSMVVMLLLGASTVFGSLRSVPMATRVLIGLAVGFAFYLLNEVLPNFTYIIGLPPIIGVFIPSIIFTILAIMVLNRRL